jgi:amidophosphoribosyltransferase
MAKDVGAKKVYVASCAPPIRYPNVYGIDMPSRKELVAHSKDEEAIAESIGADLVIFQTLPDLVESVRQWNPKISEFDCSVFTGKYVTGGVDEAYLEHLESLRADNVRGKLHLSTLLVQGKGDGEAVGKGGANGATYQEKSTVSSPTNRKDDNVGLHNSFQT